MTRCVDLARYTDQTLYQCEKERKWTFDFWGDQQGGDLHPKLCSRSQHPPLRKDFRCQICWYELLPTCVIKAQVWHLYTAAIPHGTMKVGLSTFHTLWTKLLPMSRRRNQQVTCAGLLNSWNLEIVKSCLSLKSTNTCVFFLWTFILIYFSVTLKHKDNLVKMWKSFFFFWNSHIWLWLWRQL